MLQNQAKLTDDGDINWIDNLIWDKSVIPGDKQGQ